MGNIPLFRGVADRTGCSAPSPVPSPKGRGVAKGWGIFPLFRGVSDRTGCSLPIGSVADYPVRLCLPPLRRRGIFAGWPTGRSVHFPALLGSALSPVPSHSGRGVGKGWGYSPL